MRFLTFIAVAVLGVAAVAAWVVETEPDIYLRARYPLEHEHVLRGHARNYDLDPALLAAVVYVESRFDADAESAAGAIGLMQLLPDTAKGIALRTGSHSARTVACSRPRAATRWQGSGMSTRGSCGGRCAATRRSFGMSTSGGTGRFS